MPDHHDRIAAAIPVGEARLVLDLGCGSGRTMAALSHRLSSDARLIGLDRDPRLFEPFASDARVEALVADISKPLPFGDASVDAAVCFNTLECIPNKQGFLAEVSRILVPGGHFLLGHSDFDTMVFSTPDLALTRRLVHTFCDSTQRWMDSSDGTMGRKLLTVARRSTFEVVETFAWVRLDTEFHVGGPARLAVEGIASAARKQPDLADHLEAWISDLNAHAARGELLFSVNDYAVLLQEPRL
jgi:SAM-dependent methyltransferase